ncbi:histone-lysine N-methyltransferase SETMAR-like [Mycetomoellerius zeteki]|uniref:histone-lysine N-methyltransferase SETMAR-like n=1 Tax=Mycetomoellerius zeteki TaxID=64791 RepID=UPI00084E6763|nr:PREDICTED: histone-lysine N-methyltransferase SETMAR-like [Trachymyrmex zeteki]
MALSADTCERWFAHFHSGEFNFQDALRSGWPNAADDDQLLAAVKSDRHLTTREIAERFGIHHTIVVDRLKKLDPFLKRIITGDEKWVVYNNIKQQKSWCGLDESLKTMAKSDLHPQKVMLSI